MPENTTRALRIDSIRLSEDPGDYYPSEALLKAFEIAIALGKPLLLSGEPGTGKTQFAYWAAHKLAAQTQGQPNAYLPKPFFFPVKSSSQSAELFYQYDAVAHFRSGGGDARPFVTLRALGLAYAQSLGALSPALAGLKGIGNLNGDAANSEAILPEARSSVVLIDEIDKAPREFPNDLLHEIENGSFYAPELHTGIQRNPDKDCRTTLILTSNSEKNLPNAFLRRCVFFHIEFPASILISIARLRLQTGTDTRYDAAIAQAIEVFLSLREKASTKKPTTSELLDWLGVLRLNGLLDKPEFPPTSAEARAQYDASIATLMKTTEDMMLL
ncbi:MAG: MoxR family ATPase [Bacteroidetes bacterium]|nr:MoxR family ATPase [Bacteroidota bacterium]